MSYTSSPPTPSSPSPENAVTTVAERRVVRTVSVNPGKPVTGLIAGSGPQVTVRHRGDPRRTATLDALLMDGVGDDEETVAVILSDRMSAEIGPIAALLVGRRATISATRASSWIYSYRVQASTP